MGAAYFHGNSGLVFYMPHGSRCLTTDLEKNKSNRVGIPTLTTKQKMAKKNKHHLTREMVIRHGLDGMLKSFKKSGRALKKVKNGDGIETKRVIISKEVELTVEAGCDVKNVTTIKMNGIIFKRVV